MNAFRIIIQAVFYLPGTFLHELAHFTAALLLGRPEGFSVLPRASGNSIVFGKTAARVRFRVLGAFIAAAPLVWWVVLFALLVYLRVVQVGPGMRKISFAVPPERVLVSVPRDVFYLWLSLQLFWAGRLSLQDIETLAAGLLSPSGLLLALGIALFYTYMTYVV
ncbi:MAG TPA: hypothetical protein VF790_09220 [Dissulfurispiraceae bacterium]